MAESMPRHDEPRAAVTEADVLAHLSRSRKPQSLREIAAALDLRHSGRRALVKLARKMKKRGEIHEYPNGRVALPTEKQAAEHGAGPGAQRGPQASSAPAEGNTACDATSARFAATARARPAGASREKPANRATRRAP